jgi:hypothetical protein
MRRQHLIEEAEPQHRMLEVAEHVVQVGLERREDGVVIADQPIVAAVPEHTSLPATRSRWRSTSGMTDAKNVIACPVPVEVRR